MSLGKSLDGKKGLLAILALYLVILVFIRPYGEFALNDDWNYSWSVKHLLDTGEMRIPGFISPSVVAHVLWGFLFAKAFGFSYAVLKVSTLLLAIAGSVAAYFVFRELGLDDFKSFAGAILLSVNPVYFSLGLATFMTDTNFVAVSLFSILFYIKALRSERTVWFVIGGLFASIAFLIRQTGLFIPAAAFFYLFVLKREGALNFGYVYKVLGIPILTAVSYFYWYFFVHGATGYLHSESPFLASPFQYPFRLFAVFMYMGLFLFPASLSFIPRARFFLAERKIIILAFFVLLISLMSIAVLFYRFGMVMPYLPNILNEHGLGPSYLQGEKNPSIGVGAGLLLSVFSAISGTVLFVVFLRYLLRVGKNLILELRKTEYWLYVFSVPFFLFLFVITSFYDRYILFLVVPASFFMLSKVKTFSRPLFTFGVALMLAFSVAGTQDYQAWNQAKSEAIDSLLLAGVPNSSIEGGYEYDCSNFCYYSLSHPEKNIARGYDPDWVRTSAYVINSTYVVSFSPVARYKVVSEFPYFSYLTMREERIYVSKIEE